MRTRPAILLLLGVSLGMVIVLASFVRAPEVAGVVPLVPAPLADRGVLFASASGANVSQESAIRVAMQEVGDLGLTAKVSSNLVIATDPMLADTATAIKNRKIWVVQLDGLSQYVPGPLGPDGQVGVGHTIRRGFVYVDADTGEYLVTIWSE